jgi:uncharacterized membrane protein YhaH (DUF805 family)
MDFKAMLKFWWNAMTKDIFNFKDSTSRKEYWIVYGFTVAFLILTLGLNFLFFAPSIWGSIAILSATVRRYRDLNKPVWYTVINYIWLINLYGLYLTLVVKGERD